MSAIALGGVRTSSSAHFVHTDETSALLGTGGLVG
jgi:hypothetical protein